MAFETRCFFVQKGKSNATFVPVVFVEREKRECERRAMEDSRAVEAERWLAIAEKLLATRDLHGCKTFAVRARDSDPRQLRFSEQILAVADTLIAGETRINNQHDWYAILQLSRNTQDPELVAAQYRRLALLLNPSQNRLPFADHAFRLVADAWSVLSNEGKKALYDDELSLLKLDPIADLSHPGRRAVRKSPRSKVEVGEMPSSESARMSRTTEPPTHSVGTCFWTACPYCYNLYEYPTVYEDCVLRCQNCQRAFHAVRIASPPAVGDGKNGYFCCWGFFPLGFSMNHHEDAKTAGGRSNWVPFSPMFACPLQNEAQRIVSERPEKMVVAKNVNGRRTKTPVSRRNIVMDDDYDEDEDELLEVSAPSDDSDDEWDSVRKKKKTKIMKGKGLVGRVGRKPQGERVKKGEVEGGSGETPQGLTVEEDAEGPSVSKVDMNSKAGGNNGKKPVKGVKELGKLDLNVEFSNEVEEAAVGVSEGNGTGNGEDDNIEGISFFEGLDEFLNSLPILSVVSDDKVKAA